jgi:hypothetical protein
VCVYSVYTHTHVCARMCIYTCVFIPICTYTYTHTRKRDLLQMQKRPTNEQNRPTNEQKRPTADANAANEYTSKPDVCVCVKRDLL